ncbi:lysoplasmalogenase [Inhella crocodyli]|uniref:Lysoplasmalogenase n=1 Tax=Inhella crocodyli TaxID=2499851 RepID=A0A3S2UVX1_9BURK|nr:lysoplasmalogenase [Inhella crocodyli]RVT86093.1 lysoplasmalogenase [Inhella crocodyli]
MKSMLWLGAAALNAALFIGADLGLLPEPLRWIAKPAATLALIAWAWPRGETQPVQRRWLRVGLVASLAGDVALLWPAQGFLPGLVSFLLAHLAFVRSMAVRSRFGAPWRPFLAYGALAAAVLAWVIWPGLPGDLRAPVVIYVAVLVAMAGQGAAWWWRSRERDACWAAMGGALFLASDTLLAVDRFGGGVPLASLAIHALYWVSIGLISRSLPR